MSTPQLMDAHAPQVSREKPSPVPPEKLIAALQEQTQEYVQSVMQAVNDAPDGQWLAGSEERVRDLSAEFRRQAFQKAVQLRIDAAPGRFFPLRAIRPRRSG